MRRLILDQFEFDSFASEESLEIHWASKLVNGIAQFADLQEFVVASGGFHASDELADPSPFDDRAVNSPVRSYLKRFASIDVPDPCDWLMYVLFEDGLEWDAVFENQTIFIRYHWLSTA